jgi:hypothetical protein
MRKFLQRVFAFLTPWFPFILVAYVFGLVVLRNSWWFIPAVIPGLISVRTITHELAHAAVFWAYGWHVRLYFFPHFTPHGTFYFGRASARRLIRSRNMSNDAHILMSCMPSLSGFVLFILLCLLWALIGPLGVFALDALGVLLPLIMGLAVVRDLGFSFFPDEVRLGPIRVHGRQQDINRAIHRGLMRELAQICTGLVFAVVCVLSTWALRTTIELWARAW